MDMETGSLFAEPVFFCGHAYRRGRCALGFIRGTVAAPAFLLRTAPQRAPSGGQVALRTLSATLPRSPRLSYPLRPSATSSPEGARLAASKSRTWFCLRRCPRHTRFCFERRHSATSPTGRWPLPGRDDAPLVLSVTLSAMPAFVLRLKHQRDLGAGAAR